MSRQWLKSEISTLISELSNLKSDISNRRRTIGTGRMVEPREILDYVTSMAQIYNLDSDI